MPGKTPFSGARITRRDLLRAALAAAVAPRFVPARALGLSGTTAAGERITLGLIGAGNMGSVHLDWFLAHKQVQVVAICDVDRTKRDAAREKVEKHYADESGEGSFKGCRTYNEFEELLARPDIDAVVIAVPDHWHAIMACAACRAGKDVYCEKPLSLTVREARQMVQAARRYGTVFQTGSQQRSDPSFRRACELVRNGRIGRLRRVLVNIGEPSQEKYLPSEPLREGLDWERWLGPAPWQPYSAERCSGSYTGGWRLIRDYSGGMTTDWGAHHFDIGQWGMGTDGTGPVEIRPPRPPGYLPRDPDEQTGLTFVYASGVTMSRNTSVNGVLFEGSEGKVEVNRGHFKATPEEIAHEPIGPNELHLYESPGHQEDWLRCIRTRQRPICDVEIGASSAIVCHLGNIACWLNRPIRWDPLREEIVGDEAASRWLDRPRRAPWRIEA